MKCYKIPYSDNYYITKTCKVYKVESNTMIQLYTDAYEKYSILYNNTIFKYSIWELIIMTKYGYLDKNFQIDYKYDDSYLNTSYVIDSVLFCNSYALINGEKFMQSPQWNHLYCNQYGLIYSTKSKQFLKHTIDKDGYHRITIDKYNTNYAIHRLVYSCWNQIILDTNRVVHHKDSNKDNNYYLNLEYTSFAMNTRYSILQKEKKLDIHYTEEDIHKMCQMMENGKSYRDIAIEFGIDYTNEKEYKNFRNRLSLLLQQKSAWVDISSQYNFKNYTGNKDPNMKYTTEDIINIRKLRKDGNSCKYIAEKYGTTEKYISAICSGKKRPNG